MKATYIKPVTDIVVLDVKNAFLQDQDVTGGSNYGKYSDSAEGNMGSFSGEEDGNDFIIKSTSLWDE